jgi:hypothetical protein
MVNVKAGEPTGTLAGEIEVTVGAEGAVVPPPPLVPPFPVFDPPVSPSPFEELEPHPASKRRQSTRTERGRIEERTFIAGQ